MQARQPYARLDAMKTKTVELYADLYPGWHESPASTCSVWAQSNPSEKPDGYLRVKIVVELPEHSRPIQVDETVQGVASVEGGKV